MLLESFQCSAADDDVDGDPDHHDGGDAGDAQVYVDADADAGDDAEDYASDHMGVERRASRRAHVARLHCESVEGNERVVRMRGTMWYVSLCIASSLSRMKMLLLIVLRA